MYSSAPKACNKASLLASWFSGLRARSGQTCNFGNSHPAAYFFLCQLLAVGSACGLLDLTIAACGTTLASVCVKCSSPQEKQPHTFG